MIVLLSPAKTLDFDTPPLSQPSSEPRFPSESAALIKVLRQLDIADIAQLMKLSDKLSELNRHRYEQWRAKPTVSNTRPAVQAFQGDVYQGLKANEFRKADITFAQKHLRILSGLYGLLKPLDGIQPYRLEMGTRLKIAKANNLYQYWGDKITQAINNDIRQLKANALINLASNEYAKVVSLDNISVPVINPIFKDTKNGQLKIISFYAKKARGMMARFIIRNRLAQPDQILDFNDDGYCYSEALSAPDSPVFIR